MVRKFVEIIKSIRETPQADREVVDEYHAPLVEEIDSTYLAGSFQHRMLHQAMWFQTFVIFNGYYDIKVADREFNEKRNGDCLTQRERFNIWYAQTYEKGKIGIHADSVIKRADLEALGALGKHLEEVVIAV